MIAVEQYEHIHTIWDQLAEYPASRSQQALTYLLQEVSGLVSADHAYWLCSLRFDVLPEQQDPMMGWRPRSIVYHNELPADPAQYKRIAAGMEARSYQIDESTRNHLEQTGRFRATLQRDLVSPAFYETPNYIRKYKSRNITDTMYVVAPITEDAEVYFVFNRIGATLRFSEQELNTVSYVLRGLKWFHKQAMLGQGLLVTEKPLTVTEKRVMHLLLTDLPEKLIADQLGQQPGTTRKHINSIYRKFNVNSRAGLMAIWLGG